MQAQAAQEVLTKTAQKKASRVSSHCSFECIHKIVLKGRLVGLQMMHGKKEILHEYYISNLQ